MKHEQHTYTSAFAEVKNDKKKKKSYMCYELIFHGPKIRYL